MNNLILPVRGEAEGFSAISLGLLGTGWAVGYVAGCLRTPFLVARVGHIRAFGAMCVLAAIAVLMLLVLIDPRIWIPLRSVSGFCFAGAAMIVESWFSECSEHASRGRIFGIYTMINLAAKTAGQIVLTLGDAKGYFFFVLAAMIYCFALMPTAVFATKSPQPLTSVSLNFQGPWRNSPLSFVAVFIVGISNASFGTLAAVFATRMGLSINNIALFVSVPILAAAALQIPVDILSDRFDRRRVLIVIALIALLADSVFVFSRFTDPFILLGLSTGFGAVAYSMYPVIVAHANDRAAPGTFIQVSGGLLLVYCVGAIIGPTISGFAMARCGPYYPYRVCALAPKIYTRGRGKRQGEPARDACCAYVDPRNSCAWCRRGRAHFRSRRRWHGRARSTDQ
ncbi:MAG: MFS transporter [Planktotalea arctica]